MSMLKVDRGNTNFRVPVSNLKKIQTFSDIILAYGPGQAQAGEMSECVNRL